MKKIISTIIIIFSLNLAIIKAEDKDSSNINESEWLLEPTFIGNSNWIINAGIGYQDFNIGMYFYGEKHYKESIAATASIEYILFREEMISFEASVIGFQAQEFIGINRVTHLPYVFDKNVWIPSFTLNYYPFKIANTILTKVNLGFLTIPFASWDCGIGILGKMSDHTFIQLSYKVTFDFLLIAKDKLWTPPFIFLSIKYQI